MPTGITASLEQAGPNFGGNSTVRTPSHREGGWLTPKFHWLLLMLIAIAPASRAQPVSGQRPEATTNRPKVVAESRTRESIFKVCAQVEPDASHLIPQTFGGRTEASGSGAYAYKRPSGCPYWVVDFLMNRFSHTSVTETGMILRHNVLFTGDAFDLPGSRNAGGTRPIVEEDCRRLEVDVLVYRKDPNENMFRLIKFGNGRFSTWDEASKTCALRGLPEAHSERAPNSNMLKIRIAVRVKLRDSWQQAAGYANIGPPN